MRFGNISGSHRNVLLFATLTIGCALGVAAVTAAHHSGPWPAASIKEATHSGTEDTRGYARVVKTVVPAVVNISTSRITKQDTSSMRDMPQMDPFFRQFFGDEGPGRFNVPKERREKSLGSGVIVSPEGYILTNNHVVDGATEITVTLKDKREFKAELVGTDPRTDIAVLKIDGTNLPYVTLGDSSKVQVGDVVLAIGNPFGVGQTVTMGIVSAMGRANLGIEDYEDFIQTDASINPGNSGGALVDDEGAADRHQHRHPLRQFRRQPGYRFRGAGQPGASCDGPDSEERQSGARLPRILPQDVTPAMAKAFGAKEAKGAW